jgi:hypothetical protein
MDGPKIAIIGSPWLRDQNGARRQDAEALEHEGRAKAACEAIGVELARARCRLFVYSAEEHSIEPDVVEGYLSVSKERHSIEFRHPRGSGGRFKAQDWPERPIKDRGDPTNEWEVSFYRSLKDADGVLLLGGRSTVLIAGHVSFALERPVAAVASFEGAAASVWGALKVEGHVTAEEIDEMGQRWTDDSATNVVGSLVRRCVSKLEQARAQAAEVERYRREDASRRSAQPVLVVTGVSFALVVLMMLMGLTSSTTGAPLLVPFLLALVLAGVAGAGVRLKRGGVMDGTWSALVPGGIAGFIFAVLYLLPQLSNDQGMLSASQMNLSIRLQIMIAPVLALMGGMAADGVFASLQKSADTQAAQLPLMQLMSPGSDRSEGETKKPSAGAQQKTSKKKTA